MLVATANKRRPRHTRAGIELPRADGRTLAAKRYRVLVDAYGEEFGGSLTEAEKALIQQVATLQLRIEQLQAEVVQGRDVDADDRLIRLSSEHRRLLGALRGKAESRKVAGPTALQEYLAARAAAQADDANADSAVEPETADE